MPHRVATVKQYLADLSAERRRMLAAVRQVFRDNLDADYEEGMQYGMIGYYVPHRIHPAGYHCDPKQPLPFAGLSSQKNYCSIHLMCLYADKKRRTAFEAAWKKAGKKLDMGKACIRFKSLDDLALDVLADVIRSVPAQDYVARCEASLAGRKSPAKQSSASRASRRATPQRAGSAKKTAAKAKTKAKSASGKQRAKAPESSA